MLRQSLHLCCHTVENWSICSVKRMNSVTSDDSIVLILEYSNVWIWENEKFIICYFRSSLLFHRKSTSTSPGLILLLSSSIEFPLISLILFAVKPLTVEVLNPPATLVADRRYEIICESSGSRPNAVITWYKGKRQLRRTKVNKFSTHFPRDQKSNYWIKKLENDKVDFQSCFEWAEIFLASCWTKFSYLERLNVWKSRERI